MLWALSCSFLSFLQIINPFNNTWSCLIIYTLILILVVAFQLFEDKELLQDVNAALQQQNLDLVQALEARNSDVIRFSAVVQRARIEQVTRDGVRTREVCRLRHPPVS